MTIWEPFDGLRKRNKLLFTIIVAAGVVLFWKGVWELSNVVIDNWLFGGHLFWANAFSILLGLVVVFLSGLVVEKLA
ncbi:hypothetical protein KKH30_03185 [Candidatus Micrarchaeota archaeon]|nr:hypothetical protein [Candidatus Micrarchaeota archaeon]MBU1939740.1 hypothetical protein [Candidatus Micrarchaeota archaeon]